MSRFNFVRLFLSPDVIVTAGAATSTETKPKDYNISQREGEIIAHLKKNVGKADGGKNFTTEELASGLVKRRGEGTMAPDSLDGQISVIMRKLEHKGAKFLEAFKAFLPSDHGVGQGTRQRKPPMADDALTDLLEVE